MRQHLRAAVIACFAASLFAGPATAAMIAGWDFTQYGGAGTLIVTSPATSSEQLRSNYSDFDATFGAGGASQPFGTMFMDGLNGSTNITGTTQVTTTGTSLLSNLSTPGDNNVPVADEAFDASAGVLQVALGNYAAGTGQDFRNVLKMRPLLDLVQIVFEAKVSSLGAGSTGQNWEIAFAANTNTSGTGVVGIEWSTDGISYNALTSEPIDTADELITRTVAGQASDNFFWRLTFDREGTGTTGAMQFDNVTISGDVTIVPEPGTASLLVLGLVGLGFAGRRRA